MNKDTQQLFDAPWKAVNDGKTTWDNSVQTSSGYMIACGCFSAESKRLAHLPELFDALLQAVKNECTQFISLDACDLCSGCPAKQWSKLLRQVRDGK